jgi:hypothetical protein
MKVLSLLQPWASLVVTKHPNYEGALKQWETRSWKPTDRNLHIIQKHGLLIHASLGWKKSQKELMTSPLFPNYWKEIEPMPFGAIIGFVSVGRILTTYQWENEHLNQTVKQIVHGDNRRVKEEFQFGDYSAGRYAWEFLNYEKFPNPLPVKGSLSLWDYEFDRGITITQKAAKLF